MTIGQTIRKVGQRIAALTNGRGKQSCRQIAAAVGCSKSAAHRHLQTQQRRNKYPLPDFQRLFEAEFGGAAKQGALTADETFFDNQIILIAMELFSGYVLLEDVADDRRFETWIERLQPRLESLNADK